MEDKRLNFNLPLLSVRRFSSTPASQKDSRRKYERSIPAISPSPSYRSDSQLGSLRNPGSVPFVWEQSPGRPKYETKTQKHSKALVPKLPPGRILKPNQQDSLGPRSVFPAEEKLVTFKCSKEQSHIKNSDCNGDMYMDALDTLPREVKKANEANEKPRITYGPNFLTGDDTEEDSDIDFDEHENTSYKACGLLPHFCLKGSIGLLNPVPGLSVRSRLPISSANRARVCASTGISQGHEISSDITEPFPPAFESKEVDLPKKGLISFKELLAIENKNEAEHHNPTIEKTVYVDTVCKVDPHKNEQSDFKEDDGGIIKFSQIPNEPMLLDLLAEDWKQDKETKTPMGFRKDPKVNQDPKISRRLDHLPAPPPLPKSPSDSWLWRTLPHVSSKTASLRSNPKFPAKMDKHIELRNPKGLLLPITES